MSKRELSQGGSSADHDGVRKRRKEESGVSGEGSSDSVEDVRSQGLRLWNIVKDATNKDGRILSTEFMRKPNRRMYADYYTVITSPIALEDIRKSIEGGTYSSLDMIKAALELCFTNAMTYNVDGSVIYQDAKELKKIMTKAYNKMTASTKPAINGSKDPKESKTPSLTRVIKSRLQKLVEQTDDDGRLISQEFQELPDKKIWAMYYDHIKHPMSFEMIFKKIKRKEYSSAQQFSDDVELVFSNAFSFNEADTPIWRDAKSLQTKFHELMADLPEGFSLPKNSKQPPQPTTKLTLKVPPVVSAAKANMPPPTKPAAPRVVSPPEPQPSQAPPTPVATPTAAPQAPTPVVAQPTPAPATPAQPQSSAPSGILMLTPTTATGTVPGLPKMTNTAIPKTRARSIVPSPSPQPQSPSVFTSAYRPPQPQLPITSLSVPAPIIPSNATINESPATKSALALPKPRQPLKMAMLTIEATGRRLQLRHEEGVQVWMMRVCAEESTVLVSDLVYLEDEEDQHDDVEMADIDEPRAPQKRGRGRPPKNASAVFAPKPSPRRRPRSEKGIETRVKLNSVIMPEKEENSAIWSLDLASGSNIVEMGSREGSTWKVYIDRADPAGV